MNDDKNNNQLFNETHHNLQLNFFPKLLNTLVELIYESQLCDIFDHIIIIEEINYEGIFSEYVKLGENILAQRPNIANKIIT